MQNIKKLIDCEIIANFQVAVGYFSMQIKSPFLAEHAIPGQFVNIKVQKDTTDPLLRIPLAVHSINTDGISLLYKIRGKATKILSTKKPAETINILGPLGNGFTIYPNKKAILVAGGYAVSPLFALAQKLNNPIVLIGACNKEHILCQEKFIQLGAEVHIATEDGSLGHKGYVTELLDPRLRENDSNLGNDDIIIYASGPLPMLQAVAKIAKAKKIPAQISMEAYMACGIGACKGCAIQTTEGYKLCCQDGPVFDVHYFVISPYFWYNISIN
jgi:dihydroorotate dehydrogenase electron transfer subunit